MSGERIVGYCIAVLLSGIVGGWFAHGLGVEAGQQHAYEKASTEAVNLMHENDDGEALIVQGLSIAKTYNIFVPFLASEFQQTDNDGMVNLLHRDGLFGSGGQDKNPYLRAKRYFTYSDYRDADTDPDKPQSSSEMLDGIK